MERPNYRSTVGEHEVEAFPLPTVRARAPRFGGDSLFYLSSRDGADGLWSYRDGQALEIWKGSDGALQSPAAVSADGRRVAFALRRNGKQQMHVMAADGTRLRPLSSDVDVRGTASWSPDGQWIVAAGSDRDGGGLFKLPVDGAAPVRLATGPFLDPVWSPHGDLIVYCGTQVFTLTPLLGCPPGRHAREAAGHQGAARRGACAVLPDGTGLVYMLGDTMAGQDFWLLDLGTMRSRRLTRLSNPAMMRTFDVTPDRSRIVFDRLREKFGHPAHRSGGETGGQTTPVSGTSLNAFFHRRGLRKAMAPGVSDQHDLARSVPQIPEVPNLDEDHRVPGSQDRFLEAGRWPFCPRRRLWALRP